MAEISNTSNTTATIIRGVAILLAFGGAYLVTRRIVKNYQQKKEEERADTLEDEILQGGTADQIIQIEEEQSSNYDPSNHVAQLTKYIIGANFFTYEDEVASIIMPLSEADTRKLAQAWYDKYGRTLYFDLDDELDGCGPAYWPFYNCYTAPMNKLSRLGLT